MKNLTRLIMFGFLTKICSFCTSITGGYIKEDGKVYWTGGMGHGARKIETEADPATFRELTGIFGVDDHHAYYEHFTIPDSDPATFKPLSEGYSKDQNHAYWGSHRIEGADVASFTTQIVEELNSKTFCIAKDKNHVYHLNTILSNDAAHFEVLSPVNEVCKDGQQVYVASKPIAEADAPTFVALRFEKYNRGHNYYVPYYKDKNHVYYTHKDLLQRVPADPATFELISKENRGPCYAKDKNRVFCHGYTVPGADVASFEPLPDKAYCRDKNYYYMSEMRASWESPDNRVQRNTGLADDSALADTFFLKVFGSIEKVEKPAYRLAQKYAPQNIALPVVSCLPTELAAFHKLGGQAIPADDLFAKHPEIYCTYIHINDEYSQLPSDAKDELIQMAVNILNDPEFKSAFPYNRLVINYFRKGATYLALDQIAVKPEFSGKKGPVTSNMIQVERTHFMER